MSQKSRSLVIKTEVVKLETVVRTYVDGCDNVNGAPPELKDFYVDSGKGVVVIEVYVQEKP